VTTTVPYSVAARELLRNTLLDAARRQLLERTWAEITMADVARAAGVSRQTLYNEFGSRDEFAQALVLREGDRFLEAVEEAIRARVGDPAGALEAAFEVFLTSAAEDPVVRAVIFGDADGGLLPLVTTQGRPLVERAADRLVDVIGTCWPAVPREAAQLLAETLVRLAISYATLPKGPASMTAASLTTLIGPYLERVLSDAG
jgi:AcrR family transcriptional regulator